MHCNHQSRKREKKNHQKLQSSKFYCKKYIPAAYKKWSLANARISFLALRNPSLLKILPSKKEKVSSLSHCKLLDEMFLLHHNW